MRNAELCCTLALISQQRLLAARFDAALSAARLVDALVSSISRVPPRSSSIFANAAWLAADKVFRLGLGLLLTILIAREVGPAAFGVFAFCTSVVALLGSLGNLGLQSVVVRDLVASGSGQHGALIGSALLLRLAGAGVALVLSVVAIWAMRGADLVALTIGVLLALAVVPQAFDIVEGLLLTTGRVSDVTLARALAFIAAAGLRFGLLWRHAGIEWFAAAVVVESTFAAWAFAWLARRAGQALDPRRASSVSVRHLLRDCLPLTVSLLSVQVYMRIDQIMISQMLGDHQAGIFSAAVRVSEIWYFLPVTFATAASPALAAAFRDGRFEPKLRRSLAAISWFGIGCAALLSTAAPWVTDVLYGPAYAQAADIIRIHAWAGVFVATGVAASSYFVNHKLLHISMAQTLISATINFGLNLYLIPRHGIVGAAWATVVAYACSALLLNAVFARTRELFRWQLSSLWRLPR